MDELLDALAARPRRRLLVGLLDRDPRPGTAVPVEDLSPGTAGERGDVALVHHHLPKLADRGLIHWDRDAHAVRPGPAFDELRPLLELLRVHEDAIRSDPT